MQTPDEQALKCEVAPQAFANSPNARVAWGATAVKLLALKVSELRAALEIARRHAIAKQR
jgi:hypothetical protein